MKIRKLREIEEMAKATFLAIGGAEAWNDVLGSAVFF